MNDIYSPSETSAMNYHMINSRIGILIIMSLIMFVLFIYRKNARMPKGLFISSLVSCVLVLVGDLSGLILYLCSNFWICQPVIYIGRLCYIVIFPGYYITFSFVRFINFIKGLFGLPPLYLMHTHLITVYLSIFVINALLIFVIVRLILFIKQKVSPKEPQIKQ
jgi:hypothetical protein